MNAIEHDEQPPWYSIAMLSMTALAYEILLMRLFSIIQWHHFAYMIISLALLGYGASGTFLSLFRNYLLPRYSRVYLGNIVLFGFSSLICYLFTQQIQFNAEIILWDVRQSLLLMAIYIVLALPFFFVANAIGITLIRHSNNMSRIYAADLLGAGMGSVFIIALLFAVFPDVGLRYIFVLAMLATILACWELYKRSREFFITLPIFLIFIILAVVMPNSWTELKMSPYKELSQTLNVMGTKVIAQRSSPLGLLTVVESPVIPFRHAPGLSLNTSIEPLKQLGVFTDGDAMTPITQYSGKKQSLVYLDQLTSALPYHLSTINNVLILGAGGGADVLQAKFHNVKKISAIEINKQLIDLVKKDYKNFADDILSDAAVKVYAKEARGFVVSNPNSYDLIQLVLLDSFSASSAGLYALSENYLYTVEALQAYINRLNYNGYLAISRWIKLPPRDTLKLFATAISALRNIGIQKPNQHLILIRSLQTSSLLIRKAPFTVTEIASLKKFCKQRAFDVVYYPGININEANRFNILAKPSFFTGVMALLGDERDNYVKRYKFNIEPATDNKPYFFNYFKWDVLPEILSLKGEGGVPLLEIGYLILVATFLQALVFSVFIIILPLIFFKRNNLRVKTHCLKLRSFIYFLALGLAFLFIEIAFIQKFILFLHHPLYAIAVVLATFLLFAGMGSLWSKRFVNTNHVDKGVKLSVLVICTIGICYLYILDPVFSSLIALPDLLKVITTVLLIAPLAFCMGFPFPLGLSRLSEIRPELVSWVWGVNGCASVLSAVLATLLAIHFGFNFVILVALVLYILAAASSVGWLRC